MGAHSLAGLSRAGVRARNSGEPRPRRGRWDHAHSTEQAHGGHRQADWPEDLQPRWGGGAANTFDHKASPVVWFSFWFLFLSFFQTYFAESVSRATKFHQVVRTKHKEGLWGRCGGGLMTHKGTPTAATCRVARHPGEPRPGRSQRIFSPLTPETPPLRAEQAG